MFTYYNPNPHRRTVGDCTVRAISAATGEDWERIYCELCAEGFRAADMPDSNAVWGAVLRRHGFRRHPIPDTCPDCYTVRDFCAEHPAGVFVLALPSHVVTVVNGDWLDTWDSGNESPLYFWMMED